MRIIAEFCMRCMAACRLLFAAAGKPNKSSLHFEMKDATADVPHQTDFVLTVQK